jgi:lauroyl/myristoyl acyltransferase
MGEIDSRQTEEEILTEYHSHLEDYIREYPAQWVWFHKRWRTLTDGTRLSARNYPLYLKEELSKL